MFFGQQKWTQLNTVASLSRLALRPDVLMIIITSPVFFKKKIRIYALPRDDSQVFGACIHAHRYTQTERCTRSMDGPYPKAGWQAAGDGARASCSCPTSAQLTELWTAFEQPITPTQHRGKAISSRGTPLPHQMAREMNRAIILGPDNSSDEAN